MAFGSRAADLEGGSSLTDEEVWRLICESRRSAQQESTVQALGMPALDQSILRECDTLESD